MTQTLNAQRPAAQQFTLMVLPEDGWPAFEDFDDVNLLIARIKALLGTPVCLYAFLGTKLSITAGPHRFLQTPMGSLPLFDIPVAETVPAAQYGWVGPDMDTPKPPTTDSNETEQEVDIGANADNMDEQVEDETSLTVAAETDTPVF